MSKDIFVIVHKRSFFWRTQHNDLLHYSVHSMLRPATLMQDICRSSHDTLDATTSMHSLVLRLNLALDVAFRLLGAHALHFKTFNS